MIIKYILLYPGTCEWEKTEEGGCCQFPFIYNGEKYTSCTPDKYQHLWCATTANYDQHKLWGHCVTETTGQQINI